MTMTVPPQRVLFSIGHSNHKIDRFLDLLAGHGIELVADIRSMPTSRAHPHFAKSRLTATLAEQAIAYEFLGKALGGKPRDPAFKVDGVVSHALIAASEGFAGGLDRLTLLAATQRTVMMCAEREPPDCHRSFLVAPALVARGWTVQHILADGTLVDHADLGAAESGQQELFGPDP